MNQENIDYYMENEEELNKKLCNLSLDDIVDIEIELRGGF